MNKNKLNNNGFSLVELIIVIAIMAVLVGVLAPQFIGYVEKSKKSNDVSTVDSIANACDALAIDPEVKWTGAIKITVSTSGVAASQTPAVSTDNILTKFEEIIPTTSGKKKASWGDIEITAAKSATTGKVTYTLSHDILDYSTDLKARLGL